MRVGLAIIYVMASIWIVGMIISITGVPFGKDGLVRAATPRAGVAAAAGPAPALSVPAAAAPPASASQPQTIAAAVAAPAQDTSHTSHASVAATETKGGQLLEPQMEGDVKRFDLEAKVIKWEVVPGTFIEAWAYNGQVPGPVIRVSEGDRIRVNLKNSLPEGTVLHFHGPNLPNSQDGVPDVTQKIIDPGQTFAYEFTADPSGTFVYHTHHNSAVQEPKGLYGMFIIEPRDSGGQTYEGAVKEGRGQKYDREYLQVVGELGGFFVINGKAFPATEPMVARPGERVLIRLAKPGANGSSDAHARPPVQHRRHGWLPNPGLAADQGHHQYRAG